MSGTYRETTDFAAQLPRYHFEEYMTAVDAVVDEAKIRATEDGIETEAVDPANVAMVEARLGASAFSEYDADGQTFGVNARRLSNLAAGVDEAFLDLDFTGDSRMLALGTGPYQYEHKCMDPSTVREEPSIPDMDLGFEGQINSTRLREAVEWFDEFTTHVRIGFDSQDQTFWMKALERDRSGNTKTDEGRFELARGDLEYVREAGEADSGVSMDYFRDIVDAIPEDYTVTIRAGEDFPVELSYDIGWEETGPNEGIAHGEVRFVQAPRIQA